MLEIEARDGAARIGRWTSGEGPDLSFPGVFWLDEGLPAGLASGHMILGRRPAAGVALAHRTSIFERPAETAATPTTLLLERRLGPTPAMDPSSAPLETVGPVAVLRGALSAFRNPKDFAAVLTQARRAAGYGPLLYGPGLGEPSHLALLAWAGLDLFDAVPLQYGAARGRYLTSDGDFESSTLDESECLCAPCRRSPPSGLDEKALSEHNQWAASLEMARVRNAIRNGRLRELVETRARNHPELAALLRRLDAQEAYFDERTAVVGRRTIWTTTKESLRRPDVLRFRRRMLERYDPVRIPTTLLLLPCSARKPYSTSPSHRRFLRALLASGSARSVEEWMVTSPLGIVPREIEATFPAAHYDVPVTGEWDAEEAEMIREILSTLLGRRPWDAVVAHLPAGTLALVRDLLPPEAAVTCTEGSPSRKDNLDRLESTLRRVSRAAPRPERSEWLLDRARSLATFQFGSGGAEAVLRGARVAGRWPVVRILDSGGKQLAMLPPGRGQWSLTLEGGRRLQEAGSAWVRIEDFTPRGSVFAVGVEEADPAIRIGEEVVVVHGQEVRGVGVARMSGPEMTELDHGPAVEVRHHA